MMGKGTVRIIGKPPSCVRPTSRSTLTQAEGFTLIELMLAVSIVGILASLAVPNYVDYIEKARVARAIAELHSLAKEIKGFALGGRTYPNSLADIGRATLLDPWGTPYQYWRVECGTVDDISSLAQLKLRKRNNPRVIPVIDSSSSGSGWPAALAVDNGQRYGFVRLVAGGGNGGGGGGGQNCGQGGARKDRHLHPISSDFDIYSMGKDKDSVKPLTAQKSHDDIIRASDGAYYGLARNF